MILIIHLKKIGNCNVSVHHNLLKMTIQFISASQNNIATAYEQSYIQKLLARCGEIGSPCHSVNLYYNRAQHLGVDTVNKILNMHIFLKELQDNIEEDSTVVQVIGGINDQNDHISHMIGQYDISRRFIPSVVRDTFVQIKLITKNNNTNLMPGILYNVLLTTPLLVRIALHNKHLVHMKPFAYAEDVVPSHPFTSKTNYRVNPHTMEIVFQA